MAARSLQRRCSRICAVVWSTVWRRCPPPRSLRPGPHRNLGHHAGEPQRSGLRSAASLRAKPRSRTVRQRCGWMIRPSTGGGPRLRRCQPLMRAGGCVRPPPHRSRRISPAVAGVWSPDIWEYWRRRAPPDCPRSRTCFVTPTRPRPCSPCVTWGRRRRSSVWNAAVVRSRASPHAAPRWRMPESRFPL